MFTIKTVKQNDEEKTFTFYNEENAFSFAEKEIANKQNRKVIVSNNYSNSIIMFFFR